MKRIVLIGFLIALMFNAAKISLAEDELEVTHMVLHPAAAPVPALKYKLVPGFLEKRPGNAAVIYNRIWSEGYSLHKYVADNQREYCNWVDMPLDELPRFEVERLMDMTQGVYRDYRWASRLDSCDWSQPFREGNPLVVILPEIQESRTPARLLAIRARWQISQGKFDEAIETLRTGYALGRNVAESPCLVADLVGIAICGIMSNQIETMIQQPDCPNLYWALSHLPDPLIDTRAAFDAEYDMIYLAYPELLHVDDPKVGEEYARLWVEHLIREPACWNESMWSPPNKHQKSNLRAMLLGMFLRGYPMARRALIEQGRPKDEVDGMTVAQVVAIYTVNTFNELRDKQFKWLSLPYRQITHKINTSSLSCSKEDCRREVIPLATNLYPAINAVKTAEARNQRTIALLRTIEAFRMYAASHDGRLPKKLSDITEVPIPIDPFTGKPIECRIEDGVAVLNVFYQCYSMSKNDPQRRIEIEMAE